MQSVQTRIAKPGNVPEFAARFDADRQFHGQAPDRDRAEAFLNDRLRNDESVSLLAVAGDGRLRLQAAERLARERGMSRTDLTTTRTSLAARVAYESPGWQRDELFHRYSLSIQPGAGPSPRRRSPSA